MSDDIPAIEDHAIASLGDVLADETYTGIAAVAASKLATAPGWTTLNIQQDLNKLGASPPLTEDGVAGPKTVAALKAFQTSHGLKADASVGPATEAAMISALGGMAQTYVAAGPVAAAPAPAPAAAPFVLPPPGVLPSKASSASSSSSTKMWLIGGGLAAAAAGALALRK